MVIARLASTPAIVIRLLLYEELLSKSTEENLIREITSIKETISASRQTT